jgi:hypothetical protein
VACFQSIPAVGSYGRIYKEPWPSRQRRYGVIGIVVIVAYILIALAVIGAIGGIASTETGSDRIFTTSTEQVLAAESGWSMFCQIPDNGSTCAQVTGMVSIGGTGIIAMSFTHGAPEFVNSTIYGIAELNSTPGAWIHHLSIGCQPGTPYYPDTGELVFVPCSGPNNGGGNNSVLEFNYVNASVPEAIPVPNYVGAMGFDPQLGSLYLGFQNGTIDGVNATSGVVIAAQSIVPPGSDATSFGGAWNFIRWSLLYDPNSNLLLSKTGQPDVIALNAENLTRVAMIPTGTDSWAMTVDSTNHQLYVATSTGNVLALNSDSFRLIANISISSSSCGNGGAPFLSDQFIQDPTHGDIYLAGFWYCFGAINTTGDYALSTVSAGGDGWSQGIFDPSTDTIWLYYPGDFFVSPGFISALDHSQERVLTSVIGLPPIEGELLLAGAI